MTWPSQNNNCGMLWPCLFYMVSSNFGGLISQNRFVQWLGLHALPWSPAIPKHRWKKLFSRSQLWSLPCSVVSEWFVQLCILLSSPDICIKICCSALWIGYVFVEKDPPTIMFPNQKKHLWSLVPASSKCLFDHPNGGHDSPLKGSLKTPKKGHWVDKVWSSDATSIQGWHLCCDNPCLGMTLGKMLFWKMLSSFEKCFCWGLVCFWNMFSRIWSIWSN